MIEIIITVGVFVVIVWWAANANFAPCEKCNYDCRQGRDCPNRE
jgi:hypothetical protein